jgi:hypothetical protein
MNTLSKPTTSSEQVKQLIGIVSFAAVVHSHLYWVYSIIYIAYHKISPHQHQQRATLRWKSGKFQQLQPTELSNKKKKRHSRKKSLTSKPKAIIIPTTTTSKHKVITEQKPLLQAFRTFPSPSNTKQSFNIHQLIKSQRKTRQRSTSDTLPALVEVTSRSSAEDTSSCNSTEIDEDLILVASSSNKRNRALGLLRSTFHRSHSTGQILQQSNSFSSLSDEEFFEAGTKKRTRKRDAILGITRKFSGRRNPALDAADTHITATTTEDDDHKKTRAKLFRSLSSWKKDKKTSTTGMLHS